LFAGNQAGRHSIDADIAFVDVGLIVRDLPSVIGASFHECQHASVNRLRNHPAHIEQSLVQNQKFFFKSAQVASYPNRPVM
jgi:hypothetical protein